MTALSTVYNAIWENDDVQVVLEQARYSLHYDAIAAYFAPSAARELGVKLTADDITRIARQLEKDMSPPIVFVDLRDMSR